MFLIKTTVQFALAIILFDKKEAGNKFLLPFLVFEFYWMKCSFLYLFVVELIWSWQFIKDDVPAQVQDAFACRDVHDII